MIHQAKRKLQEYDLDGLKKNGLSRDLLRYCFTATYPPLKSMKPVPSEEIYSDLFSDPMDVYFHFPFCSGRCSFCHFNVLTNPKSSQMEEYKQALLRELEILSALIQDSRTHFIYFGGGTPSMMSPIDFGRLLETLNSFVAIENGSQITLEIHPEIIHNRATKYLSEIRKLGISRVSIGVQDFNEDVLKATNRRHSPQEALRIIQVAQDLGFQVNVDLLSPLPRQTFDNWAKTLATAFSLDLDSVTFYTTSIRKSMPLYSEIQSGSEFPSEEEAFILQIMTQLAAEDAGYLENRSRWFTRRPENPILERFAALARNQHPISPLLGVGCGAYGNIHDFQYYNTPRMQTYRDQLNRWELPVWQARALNPSEKIHREMVFSMRSGHVVKEKFSRHFQADVFQIFAQQIQFLEQNGLASVSENEILLSEKGRLFSDEISTLFISPEVREVLQKQSYLQDPHRYLFESLNHFYEIESR